MIQLKDRRIDFNPGIIGGIDRGPGRMGSPPKQNFQFRVGTRHIRDRTRSGKGTQHRPWCRRQIRPGFIFDLENTRRVGHFDQIEVAVRRRWGHSNRWHSGPRWIDRKRTATEDRG